MQNSFPLRPHCLGKAKGEFLFLQDSLELLLENLSTGGAHLFVHHLTVLDEEYGGDISHTILCGQVFIFPTMARPSYSVASASITGATMRQGPHHVAQKSNTTGFPVAIRA